MMMGTIENPKISIEDLNNMEKRIKENTATSIDYKKLDDLLLHFKLLFLVFFILLGLSLDK